MIQVFCRVYFFSFFLSGYCLFAQQNFEQVSLGDGVNSSFDEKLPVFSPDGKKLYFTISNHPENVSGVSDKGDIWYSTINKDGSWSQAKNLGRPLNDRFVNSVIGFSPDGKSMYLRNFYINDYNSLVSKGISVARKTPNGWRYPENVSIEYFDNKSEHQSMSISSNGKILLMSIESYGNYGNEDLYVSFKKSSTGWTEPKNLGSTINSKFQEMTPYLAPDNRTLYFSTNGRGGEGGMDVFVSTRLDDSWKNWSVPKNLGKGVNTPGTEKSYQFIPNTTEAIVISTQNSDGYGDLKKVVLMEEQIAQAQPKEFQNPLQETKVIETMETVSLEITVKDQKTGIPLVADVELSKGGQELEFKTRVDGRLETELEPGFYKIQVSALGHLSEIDKVNALNDVGKTIELIPVEIGSTVQLSNILFEISTSHLIESSFDELDKVVKYLEKNPKVRILLSGHTDNRGDYYLNLKLSEDRVKAVKEYLVENGIEEGRIEGKGFGGKQPIADNSNEETRKLNRRVEFTVLEN
ncbi:MAG: OmpA family protein [Bacteroidota bacterium]